jgi:hypothetical protein
MASKERGGGGEEKWKWPQWDIAWDMAEGTGFGWLGFVETALVG